MATQFGDAGRFVNRTEQLSLLADRHAAAAGGVGSVVLLAGEAGAGKSRVVYEFCHGLKDAHYAIGQCLEYAQVPFGPVLAVLEQLIRDQPAILKAAPALSAVIARLLPDMEGLASSADATELDKLRQLNALGETLARFATNRVTVIVLEDLNWADGATLELLQHLPPYVAKSKIVLIGTYRREELRRGHPLRSTIAKLERHAVARLSPLKPLSDDEMHQFVFYSLENRARPSAEVVDAILERAEGNPLFAEELLKTVSAEADAGAGSIPASVREAVLERLSTFDESGRASLACAAAIGRRFEAEFLATIAERPVDEILATLKHAIDLGFIVEEDSGHRAVFYSFRHALIREAIYHELLASEARRLHARIADALEAMKDGDRTVELAYHWWSARDPQKSAEHNERAGDAAMLVFAYRDAATHFDRSLASGSAGDASSARLQGKLAEALFRAGYSERARRAAEMALEYYEKAGDLDNAAQACLSLARLAGVSGDPAGHLRHAMRALELVGENTSSPAYFSGHLEMARSFCAYSLDMSKGQQHLLAADRYRGERSAEDAVRFFEFQMTFSTLAGSPEEALAATQAASDIAARAGDAPGAARCWANYAGAMAESGQRERWREPFERAMDLLRRNKIEGITTNWTELALAAAHLTYGETRKAAELVERLVAADVESLGFRMELTRVGIPLGIWLGDADLLQRCAPPSLVEQALGSGSGQNIGALAHYVELLVTRGDEGGARTLLHRALEALTASGVHPIPGAVDWLSVHAARYGDDAHVQRARDMLSALARSVQVSSSRGYLALFEALDARRSADAEGAWKHAQAAAQAFEAMGWPYHEAQALEVAGELDKARKLYMKIDDTYDARRLDAVLNPVNRRGRTKGEMTAREREICDLLAKGKTNKAIAEELVISERTVESHVSSVLTKMEAASRAELIAKLKS